MVLYLKNRLFVANLGCGSWAHQTPHSSYLADEFFEPCVLALILQMDLLIYHCLTKSFKIGLKWFKTKHGKYHVQLYFYNCYLSSWGSIEDKKYIFGFDRSFVFSSFPLFSLSLSLFTIFFQLRYLPFGSSF